MVRARLASWRRRVEALFPERHIYIRSHGEIHGLVLSTNRQLAFSAGAGLVALWMTVCTAAMMINALSVSAGGQQAARTKAYYERLISDRQARLDSAVAQLSDTSGSLAEIAQSTEERHAALVMLLTQMKGQAGLAAAITPTPLKGFEGRSPADGIRAVRQDQDRLIDEAETYAKSRADRLRLAFRLAGLDPTAYTHVDDENLGGPLIDAKDPRALAAVLDVDEGFAERIQHAATDMSDMNALSATAADLPLAKPTVSTREASGFGMRIDPFTGRPAFHPGLDFPAPIATAVYATGPGVVSFTGVRNGYGNVVEVDHGHGLKTRFAHLSSIAVRIGEPVAIGQKLGGIGSTGRSTGPHLHYEVWVDGRPQNPQRFLEAGDYVQQTN
jgi:murein DD-endopeptidase MepM/ murein hydrolase activator NlpD